MKSIKGTITEQNLLKAFAGESQARMRYNYFASQASKDGYEQIAAVFNTTADQEKEHAKRSLWLGIIAFIPAFLAGITVFFAPQPTVEASFIMK